MADGRQGDAEERDPLTGMLTRDLDAIADAFADALSKGYGQDDQEDGDEMALFELLLDEEDRLSPKAESVCREIFGRFSKSTAGILTDAELDAFAMECNGAPFTDEEKEEMRENFDCQDGCLTLEGFLNLFALQSCARPFDTMADIKKFGYDSKLDKVDSTEAER